MRNIIRNRSKKIVLLYRMNPDSNKKLCIILYDMGLKKYGSERAFADSCNLDAGTVGDMGKGNYKLSITTLSKIATDHNKKVSYLLMLVGE